MQIYNNNNQKKPKNKKRFPEMLQIVHIQNQSERKRGSNIGDIMIIGLVFSSKS